MLSRFAVPAALTSRPTGPERRAGLPPATWTRWARAATGDGRGGSARAPGDARHASSQQSEVRPLTSLLGVVHGAAFADDRHFDLPRVLELVLDPPGDVLRQPDRLLIGDLLAL